MMSVKKDTRRKIGAKLNHASRKPRTSPAGKKSVRQFLRTNVRYTAHHSHAVNAPCKYCTWVKPMATCSRTSTVSSIFAPGNSTVIRVWFVDYLWPECSELYRINMRIMHSKPNLPMIRDQHAHLGYVGGGNCRSLEKGVAHRPTVMSNCEGESCSQYSR